MYFAILYDAMSEEVLTAYNEAVLVYLQHTHSRFIMAGKPLSKCRPARASICAISLHSDAVPVGLGFKAVQVSEKQAFMFSKTASVTADDFKGDWVNLVQSMALQARHAHEVNTTQMLHTLTPECTSSITLPLPSVLKAFTTIAAIHADGAQAFRLIGAGELRGQPIVVLSCCTRLCDVMLNLERVCQRCMPEMVHDGTELQLEDSINFGALDDLDRWATLIIECVEMDELYDQAQEAQAALSSHLPPATACTGLQADIVAIKHRAVTTLCRPVIDLSERVSAMLCSAAKR
jgi:hypothetical protein